MPFFFCAAAAAAAAAEEAVEVLAVAGTGVLAAFLCNES